MALATELYNLHVHVKYLFTWIAPENKMYLRILCLGLQLILDNWFEDQDIWSFNSVFCVYICISWFSNQIFAILKWMPWAMSLIKHITSTYLTSSADYLCKQFRPRSGPTKCRAWSGFKLFDTLMVFLKEFFWKVDFEKNQQTTKKHENFPSSLPCHLVLY